MCVLCVCFFGCDGLVCEHGLAVFVFVDDCSVRIITCTVLTRDVAVVEFCSDLSIW